MVRGLVVTGLALAAAGCSLLFSPDQPGGGSGDDAGAGETECNHVYTQVAAGDYYTCVLRLDGDVLCWGANDAGQLGINTARHTPMPTVVPLPPIVQITAGATHACAIDEDAGLRCWGDNSNGQLGTGDDTDRTTPAMVVGPETWLQVSAGENFTCAVSTGNEVFCWGEANDGQLGTGTGGPDRTTPQLVPTLSGELVEVRAGPETACARTAVGAVFCWGDNDDGGAGPSGLGSTVMPQSVPLPADAFGLDNFAHACATLTDESIHCWGEGSSGELGTGNSDSGDPLPVPIDEGRATQVATGDSHSCALFDNGVVSCWGANNYGQLASPEIDQSLPPTNTISALQGRLSSIAAGREHTCGITTDGAVLCWGSSSLAETGDGSILIREPTVVELPAGSGVPNALAAGELGTCVITDTKILCWGNNDHGELGSTDNVASSIPVEVMNFVGTAQQIGMGDAHVCALNDSGDIYCWGSGVRGRLGNGSQSSSASPSRVGAGPFRDLAVGSDFSCAVSSEPNLYCWGTNGSGQLGIGAAGSAVTTPTLHDSPWGKTQLVVSPTAGDAHACVVGPAKATYCWGRNGSGQLGNDTFVDSSVGELVVVEDQPFDHVSAGRVHTCASTSTQTYCWGAGARGQLGTGGTGPSGRPVRVSGLGGSDSLALDDHACSVVIGEDSIKCWGDNVFGHSVPGSPDTSVPTPTSTALGGSVAGVAAGREHTCAIVSGSIMCWGSDRAGMAGSGRDLQITDPVRPVGLCD